MSAYKKINHTVSLINYHFVFCPRYRRKIFLHTEVEGRFKQLVEDTCDHLGIQLITIECEEDHAHLFLNALPTMSPAEIMAKIKGVTSKILREEFSQLQHLPSLWTRSFFVSTDKNVSTETIKNYVTEQKTRG